jgi:ABC-type lipoprotein release transport system permease subunit
MIAEWNMAVRQCARGWGRSRLLAISITLSSFVLVITFTLVSSIRANIETAVRTGIGGDLRITHESNPLVPLFAEVPVMYRPVPDTSRVTRAILDDAGVIEVVPRTAASAVAFGDERQVPAVVLGFDPDLEADAVRRLIGDRTAWGAAPRRGEALLGAGMAARLDAAAVGDEVTLLLPTPDGFLDGDVFRVAGTYRPQGMPVMDDLILFVHALDLEFMLGEDGPRDLVARLAKGADAYAVRDRLQADLVAAGFPVQVHTWDEIAVDFLGIADVGRLLIGIGFAFVCLIVVVGAANTFLILFIEREREIGLMRALGASRTRVVATLVVESSLLSTLASAAGVVLGVATSSVLGAYGIPAVSQAMAYAIGGDRLFPQWTVGQVAVAFLTVSLIGPLATVLPALRAGRANPAHVMRDPE